MLHLQSHCNRWRFQIFHQSPYTVRGQFHPRVCLFIHSVAARKPKMLHNSSKHITRDSYVQLQPFFSDVNACKYITAENQSAQGHPCWKHVGSDLIVLECIHHPWERQQSQRRSLHCGKILYSQPVRMQPSVCLYFCLKGKDSSNGTFVQPERYLKEVYVFKRGGDHRLPNIRTMCLSIK